jgi:hypothetical protein
MASPALRLPDPTPVQERVVEQLRRDGVAIVPFAELFADGARWQDAVADMEDFVAETEALLPSMSHDDRVAAFGKAFLVRRYRVRKGEDKPTFGLDNPWVRMGASPELLGIVNAYRGEPMRLHDVDNWYTVPDAEAARSASQRWHRDGWENHIVKVFTYFNEVDEEAGPFEYILGSAAGGRYGSLWPWEDKEVYPPQDELEAAVDPADCRSLTGGPGAIVFCDTSGFHRGGFARSRPRILSYHTYLSDAGQERHRRKFEVDLGGVELPEESAYALG